MPDAFILKQFICQPNLPNTAYDNPSNADTIRLFVNEGEVARVRYRAVPSGSFIDYDASRGDVVNINNTYAEGAVIKLVDTKSEDVNPTQSDGYSFSITGVWLRD